MELVTKFEELKKVIENAAADVGKAAGGNKAAAVRVRKAMQDVKAAANEVRVASWEHGPSADDVAKEVGRSVGGPGADKYDPDEEDAKGNVPLDRQTDEE